MNKCYPQSSNTSPHLHSPFEIYLLSGHTSSYNQTRTTSSLFYHQVASVSEMDRVLGFDLRNQDNSSNRLYLSRPEESRKLPIHCSVLQYTYIGNCFALECHWYTVGGRYDCARCILYNQTKFCSLYARIHLHNL